MSSTQIKNELTVSRYEVVQDAYKPSPYECEGAVFSSSEMHKVRTSFNSDFQRSTANIFSDLDSEIKGTGYGVRSLTHPIHLSPFLIG